MGGMSGAELYLVLVVGVALMLFLRGRTAPDLVGLLVLLALALPASSRPKKPLRALAVRP